MRDYRTTGSRSFTENPKCCSGAKDIALLAVGSMVKTAHHVSERLKEKGIKATLVNVRFVKPLDHALFEKLAETHRRIVTLEENVVTGGFRTAGKCVVS